MGGRESHTYIDFDVYGCWLEPATGRALVCQFQQHREIMRAVMDRTDPDSKQSVLKWAFAHGWIKIENERDADGSQVNLQGHHDTLKAAWPLLRRDLLHIDNIFIDIEDLNRHIRWTQYKDRERIRAFDIGESGDPATDGVSLSCSPCFQF